MTPLELVHHTSSPIHAAGQAFYFQPDTLAKGKEIGLDGFRFYVLGRGGVLGDVEPAVVTSAFGYFAPGLVAKMWNSGKQTAAPRDVARAYLACAEEFGRKKLADAEGLDAFNAAAETVIEGVDVSSLALFAGLAAEPLPDDAPARAYRNVCALRELRGCLHLVAIVAGGLAPAVAHAIRRPDDVANFGWPEAPAITEEERTALAAADELTDRLLASAFAPLSDAQADAFGAGVAAIAERIG